MSETTVLEAIAKDPDAYIVHFGEVLLKDWADNVAGESVEFWLDSSGGAHPFKPFKASRRVPGGSRFIAFVVEINDDETPISQVQKERIKSAMGDKVKSAKHSQSAAILCQDQAFHSFLAEKALNLPTEQKHILSAIFPPGLYSEIVGTKMAIVTTDKVKGEEFAKCFLYWFCGMTSRRELDYSPKKFEAFRSLREEFYLWGAS